MSRTEELIKLAQSGDRDASELLVTENAGLIWSIARRYTGRGTELEDLYQRMQQSVQDNQQAYQKAQAEKMQAISEKVLGAVKQIGEAGGYVYIMDVSQGIPFINSKLSTDITPELKKALGI
jgi:outer membrane protein